MNAIPVILVILTIIIFCSLMTYYTGRFYNKPRNQKTGMPVTMSMG